MVYQSVDKLQNVLAKSVFHYAKDAKKASGRALGTLVEIITFYLLKSWGLENSISIEKSLGEYGNPDIKHNVEYSLHPILRRYELEIIERLPLTAIRILSLIDNAEFSIEGFYRILNNLLSTNLVLRNSCTIAGGEYSFIVANLVSRGSGNIRIAIMEQYSKPFGMVECKRVGIEEGTKRGPQTIEKAKQGAYVAKAVSSLQKIRVGSGELRGLIYKSENELYTKPYEELLAEVVASNEAELLRDFILTVGVVSNHGNWFTSDNHNKELKVLAQSYDWLIFLTDEGLAEFITELLLVPTPILEPARTAFLASYSASKVKNQFTKVQMDFEADQVLQSYFRDNLARVQNWFNIITPNGGSMDQLQYQLCNLRDKNWRNIHSL